MKNFVTLILLFNLLALSFGEYSFFDQYIKKFLENVFKNNKQDGGRLNPSRSNTSRSYPDLRPPTCDCTMQNHNRIVGGKESPFIPWLTSLGYVFKDSKGAIKYSHFCGGFILNEIYILTAGHCLKELQKSSVNNYLIRHGITDLNEKISPANTIQWADFQVNEKYLIDDSDNGNDVGVIKLKKPIDLKNSRSKPACIDFSNDYSPYLSLSGWGRTTPFGKHNQTGATLPTKLLQLDMTEDKSKSKSNIISAKGKAKGSGTCSGDSGSPLQSISPKKIGVVGLVSYGVSNLEGVFCLSNTGFVRLQAHSKFINNAIGEKNYCRI